MKTIGIDLGTTNCIAATREKGTVRTLKIDGAATVPSVVHFNSKSIVWTNVDVGRKAKAQLMINPQQTVRSAKRFMGDINKTWSIHGNRFSPVDISSFILEKIQKESSEILGEKIKNAVITVPAYFNGLQKSQTKKAGEKAGLNVLALVKEPTAAAIAYGLDQEKDQTIMVYDLGGGTFDVTIIDVKGNKFSEKAIDGDSYLGGDDFDEALKRYLIKEFEDNFKSFKLAPLDEKVISEIAEKIKIELSSLKRVEENVILSGGKYTLDIDIKIDAYQSLIQDRVDETIVIMKRALQKANIDKDDIGRIILVGGSTKSPIIFERLSYEIKTPYRSDNVDEIVAQGAAILAHSLSLPVDEPKAYPIELEKITPFNMGLRVTEGESDDKFSIIIPEQNSIPCIVQKTYTTEYENQSSVPIGVYQGFGQNCTDPNVHFIGGFIMDGIPPARKKEPNIEVTFNLNDDDILMVKSECTGVGAKTINLNINETNDPNELFKSTRPTAVVLCIDVSGSMGGRPIKQAKKAACAYADRKQGTGSDIGCTVFGSSSAQVSPLSGDMNYVKSQLNKIKTGYKGCGYGTNMEEGLRESMPLLSGKLEGYNKQIIVLSDGYTAGNVRGQIPVLQAQNITAHTVGTGRAYDRALLEELATKTGGVFVPADDIDTLVEAFLSLAEK